jgi:LysR family nod box-dependent transcriptional activator
MRLKGLDLNLLIALDILLEERSVSRAAERLHLSQPAASAALARLRDYFRDDLLVLHGKRMIPTSYAESLFPEVKSILTQVDSLIAMSTDFDPRRAERVFRLMASDYITAVLIGPAVRRLQELAPRIQLDLRQPNEKMVTDFERGEIDLILTPEPYISPDHPAELVFEERHVVVGWEKNSVLWEPLTQESFLRCAHVAVTLGPTRAATFADQFLDERLKGRSIEIFAPSFTLVPWLLIGTTRLAVMHERLAEVFMQTMPLKSRQLPIDMPPMREMVQFHSARANDQGLAWLRRLLQETANAHRQSIDANAK